MFLKYVVQYFLVVSDKAVCLNISLKTPPGPIGKLDHVGKMYSGGQQTNITALFEGEILALVKILL